MCSFLKFKTLSKSYVWIGKLDLLFLWIWTFSDILLENLDMLLEKSKMLLKISSILSFQ